MPTMKLCPRNHYYDSDRYSSCPYCSNDTNRVNQQRSGNVGETEPVNFGNGKRVNKTVSMWDTEVNPRVVGWLVCTFGSEYGKDFRLHADTNFVGRDPECEVCLSDSHISSKHFTVTYDPLNDNYFATMCGGRAIVYVNNTPLMPNQLLKKGDKIRVGKTELVFVPLESSIVRWKWEQN